MYEIYQQSLHGPDDQEDGPLFRNTSNNDSPIPRQQRIARYENLLEYLDDEGTLYQNGNRKGKKGNEEDDGDLVKKQPSLHDYYFPPSSKSFTGSSLSCNQSDCRKVPMYKSPRLIFVPPTSPPSWTSLVAQAQQILWTFIRTNSPKEVKLPPHIRTSLLNEFNDPKTGYQPDIFDEAVMSIVERMESTTFPLFLQV